MYVMAEQLSEKYKEIFDVMSEGPSFLITLAQTVQKNKYTYIFVSINYNIHMHHGIIIYWNGFLQRIFN
jgi:hypothetical protein